MVSRQPTPIAIRNAGFYVLSGCIQPLLITLLKEAGLADPKCQFFMVLYYVMPAMYLLPIVLNNRQEKWPHRYTIYKACGCALWDIASQSLNFTGATMSGPTIFSIIYSSVTIWTAIFSRIFLGRTMNVWQWVNVFVVFAGLAVTATDSMNMGENVLQGSLLIILGSAMHGLTYVMCEAVMTVGEERLTAAQNNFVQGSVAGGLFLVWQLVYTLPNANELIRIPMQNSGTTVWYALTLLVGFGMANVVHSCTYFYTLLHFPGGATSAGLMKGVQAILVFILTDYFYCNKIGGSEMCFSTAKFVSCAIVCAGVTGYGYATKVSLETVDENTEVIEIEPVHETSKLLSASP